MNKIVNSQIAIKKAPLSRCPFNDPRGTYSELFYYLSENEYRITDTMNSIQNVIKTSMCKS